MTLAAHHCTRTRRGLRVVATAALAALFGALAAPAESIATTCICNFDCDGSCTVTHTDVRQVVAAVFDPTATSACTTADVDLDGRITAADVLAVHVAIAVAPPGCTRAPIPTPTPSPTELNTETPLPTATSSHTPTRTATTTVPTPTSTQTPHTTPVSRWVELAPLPMGGRQEVGVAHLDGIIYVIGGFAPGPSALVEAYDIATNQWSTVAPLPQATHHIGAAALDGFVYAIGGLRPPGFTPTDDVFRYDPNLDRWDPVASMPRPRGAMAVAVAGRRIHTVAGDSFGAVTDHAVYMPSENRWVELEPYPEAREHIAAAAVDGVVYVVGGRSPVTSEAYRWDPQLEWVALPPMTTRRAGHAAAELAGRLVAFGGEGNPRDKNGIFPEVEFYDPSNNHWTRIDNMRAPRHGIGAVTVGSRIYVPGGADRAAFGRVATHDALEIDF